MHVSPRSADAWVKGEFTPHLAARRSLTNELFRLFWLEGGIWMIQIKFSSATPPPRASRLPKLIQPTHTPLAIPPCEQVALAYPTNSHPARIPRPNRLPWPTQPTHTPLATPPHEQATLAYPTQGFPNRTPPHNIALSKEQLTLHLTKHNLPYMMSSRK